MKHIYKNDTRSQLGKVSLDHGRNSSIVDKSRLNASTNVGTSTLRTPLDNQRSEAYGDMSTISPNLEDHYRIRHGSAAINESDEMADRDSILIGSTHKKYRSIEAG